MPITPSGLRRFRKPVTFEFAGEDAHIEYYPAAFGSDSLDKWNAAIEAVNAAQDEASTQAAALAFGQLICEIVGKWDYCEDPETEGGPPGPMVPITPERILEELGKYPLFFPEFLRAILEAIAADVSRGKVNGTPSPVPSDATSSPMASVTSSPESASLTTSASSSSPDGSMEPPPSSGSPSTPNGASA